MIINHKGTRMEKIDTDCKQRNYKVYLNFSNHLTVTEPLQRVSGLQCFGPVDRVRLQGSKANDVEL